MKPGSPIDVKLLVAPYFNAVRTGSYLEAENYLVRVRTRNSGKK